jgi:hypothetical protein
MARHLVDQRLKPILVVAIPEPTFTTQAVVAVGAKETQTLIDDDHSAANGEKPDHTANKPMRKQEYNHRRYATQH